MKYLERVRLLISEYQESIKLPKKKINRLLLEISCTVFPTFPIFLDIPNAFSNVYISLEYVRGKECLNKTCLILGESLGCINWSARVAIS